MMLGISGPFWPLGAKRIALVSIPREADELIAYGIDLDRHRLVFMTELAADEYAELIESLCDGYAVANPEADEPNIGGPEAPAPLVPREGGSTEIDVPVVVIPGTGPQAQKSGDPPLREAEKLSPPGSPGSLRHAIDANRAAGKSRVRARRLASKAHSPTADRRLAKKTRTSR